MPDHTEILVAESKGKDIRAFVVAVLGDAAHGGHQGRAKHGRSSMLGAL